jgi:hypothetical protein
LLAALAAPWSDFAVHNFIALTKGKETAYSARKAAAARGISINELADCGFTGPMAWLKTPLTRTVVDSEIAKRSVGDASRARVMAICAELEATRLGWTTGDLLLAVNERPAEMATDGVVVCTVHAAKGREFDVVFMPCMEEGTFPPSRKDTNISEERRVAFVGMTRARERLALSWCATRPEAWGAHKPAPRQPSRFLAEAGLAAGDKSLASCVSA